MKNKFIKIISNNIFCFVMGGIIFGAIGVCASTYLYSSDQVSYENNNLTNALDELYTKSNGASIIHLGTGTSFDIKTLLPDIDYTNLTSDNFIIAPASASIYFSGTTVSGSISQSRGTSFTKSYDATTGVLTISNYYSQFSIGDWSKSGTHRVTGDVSLGTFNAYLINGKIESLS